MISDREGGGGAPFGEQAGRFCTFPESVPDFSRKDQLGISGQCNAIIRVADN